jgi:hypothetical protein
MLDHLHINRDEGRTHPKDSLHHARTDPHVLSVDQISQLSIRAPRLGSLEEQWYHIWNTLFPDAARPALAHSTTFAEEAVAMVRWFWDTRGQNILSSLEAGNTPLASDDDISMSDQGQLGHKAGIGRAINHVLVCFENELRSNNQVAITDGSHELVSGDWSSLIVPDDAKDSKAWEEGWEEIQGGQTLDGLNVDTGALFQFPGDWIGTGNPSLI